jgi:hypothetical protein
MKKLFKSKLAFIAFVIIFTTCLAFFYKDSVSIALWTGSVGGLIGFVFAHWYWIDKMKDIQDQLDARMASPETAELLKRKENELFEAANSNTKLVNIIGELQNEIAILKIPLNKVRAKFRCSAIEDSPVNESVTVFFYPVTEGSEENLSFSKYTPAGQLILTISYGTPAHKFVKENEEYYLDLSNANQQ